MTSIRSRTAFVVSALVFLLAAAPLVAFAASGDLDATFDSDGMVSTPGTIGAVGVAVQTDGKIVAAGMCLTSTGGFDFCVARYSANGSMDTTFGGGIVITDISVSDNAHAIAIQSDQKIVVAGTCGSNPNTDYCLARYNSNGSLDSSFGSGGRVTTAMSTSNDEANALAIQTDGQIVVAGYCRGSSLTIDFCLARYNTSGGLDGSFGGGDGMVTTDIDIGTTHDRASALAIQSDGKIVAAGSCGTLTVFASCLARYTPSGSLDGTFGTGGLVVIVYPSSTLGWVFDVAIQSDGMIVIAGQCNISGSSLSCLARFGTTGVLDGSFGAGGVVTNSVAGSVIAIQSNGKIVAVGSCASSSVTDFCLARYNTSGGLDGSFGSAGTVMTSLSAGSDAAKAVAIQSDGKIVAAGVCSGIFCLARYLGDAPSNQPPVAVGDSYNATQGTTLTVAAPGVLGNDTDPDAGTTLTALYDTGPTNGTLLFDVNGSFTYTPSATFSGADSFTYHASDGSLDSSIVTVTINVTLATSLQSIIDAQPKLTAGQKSSLKDKLAAAQAFFEAGRLGPACGKLNDFINQVIGLTPTKLDVSTAAILVSGANALKASYGCP